MSAASEESTSTVPDRAVTDAGTTSHQDTATDGLMLRDSETAGAAESGSNNDQLGIVSQAVHETDVTNVSSEASNSSQGLPSLTIYSICIAVLWRMGDRTAIPKLSYMISIKLKYHYTRYYRNTYHLIS